MAISLDTIRETAERVARTYGLDVVEVEYKGGGGKHRTLTVFIEKNAEGRARLLAEMEANPEALAELPERLRQPGGLELLSGVTHEDCEAFSRDFGTQLDVDDLIPGTEYTLEVSSPGLDRKLTTETEFRRFQGNSVAVKTLEAIDGNRQWTGIIEAVEDGYLLLKTPEQKKKGKVLSPAREVKITLAGIEKARLVPDF